MTTRLSIGDHVCYQAIDNTQPETHYVTHRGYIEEFNCYAHKGDSEWQTAAKIRKDSGGHTWKEVKLLIKL